LTFKPSSIAWMRSKRNSNACASLLFLKGRAAVLPGILMWKACHYGVIIVKRRKDHEVVARLLSLLDEVTAEEMKNQLRYI